MNDSYYWSAGAGRWLGIPVRVHAFLFLFVALIFGVEAQLLESGSALIRGTALVTSLVIVFSIIFHELAHIFAISNLGGHVNSIVFTPWGGSSDFAMPGTSRSRSIVFLAGPFANLMVVLIGATLLIQMDQGTIAKLINPFDPHGFQITAWEVSLLKIVTWVNFQLFIVNLIPCFPFDGAGLLRGTIESLNPEITKQHSEASIKVFGHAVAFTLIGTAWILRDYQAGPVEPVWLLLLGFGISLLFAARYSYLVETTNADEIWDDLSEIENESFYDETSFFDFPDDETSGYSQWLSEKQEARRREELRIENEELERSDEILDKLHKLGLESLSDEDKSLLKRVSDRLRSQRGGQKA